MGIEEYKGISGMVGRELKITKNCNNFIYR